MTLEEQTAQRATLHDFGRVLKDELPTSDWDRALWRDGVGNMDEQSNTYLERILIEFALMVSRR